MTGQFKIKLHPSKTIVPALKRLLWGTRGSMPDLLPGEEVILVGNAVFLEGLMVLRLGPLILTNRRLIWYEEVAAWPLKPIAGQVNLSDVSGVDEGSLFDLLSGGCLRLQLRGSKRKRVALSGGDLNEWIGAIRKLIAQAQESSPGLPRVPQ